MDFTFDSDINGPMRSMMDRMHWSRAVQLRCRTPIQRARNADRARRINGIVSPSRGLPNRSRLIARTIFSQRYSTTGNFPESSLTAQDVLWTRRLWEIRTVTATHRTTACRVMDAMDFSGLTTRRRTCEYQGACLFANAQNLN